jgi:hypothetical protein
VPPLARTHVRPLQPGPSASDRARPRPTAKQVLRSLAPTTPTDAKEPNARRHRVPRVSARRSLHNPTAAKPPRAHGVKQDPTPAPQLASTHVPPLQRRLQRLRSLAPTPPTEPTTSTAQKSTRSRGRLGRPTKQTGTHGLAPSHCKCRPRPGHTRRVDAQAPQLVRASKETSKAYPGALRPLPQRLSSLATHSPTAAQAAQTSDTRDAPTLERLGSLAPTQVVTATQGALMPLPQRVAARSCLKRRPLHKQPRTHGNTDAPAPQLASNHCNATNGAADRSY